MDSGRHIPEDHAVQPFLIEEIKGGRHDVRRLEAAPALLTTSMLLVDALLEPAGPRLPRLLPFASALLSRGEALQLLDCAFVAGGRASFELKAFRLHVSLGRGGQALES